MATLVDTTTSTKVQLQSDFGKDGRRLVEPQDRQSNIRSVTAYAAPNHGLSQQPKFSGSAERTPGDLTFHMGRKVTKPSSTIDEHKSPSQAKSSKGVPMLTASSTMSLQEMFGHEQDDVMSPSQDYVDARRDQGDQEQEPREDAWFAGDGDLFDKDDDLRPFTPPLTMYAGAAKLRYMVPPAIIPGSSVSSVASSGRNTPNSVVSQFTSTTPPNSSSIGTNGSNPLSTSSVNRPLLYSAIGSLENVNAASFQQLNKRIVGKEFSRPAGGQTTLIPPWTGVASKTTSAGAYQPDPYRTLLALEGQEQQRPKGHTRTVTPATPTSSNQTGAKTNGNQVDVTKAQQNDPPATEKVPPPGDTKPSNLRKSSTSKKNGKNTRKVSIKKEPVQKPVEMFRPSCDAYTPRIEKRRIEYKKAELRTPVQNMASPMGTLQRPNFRDALRRVAMIIHQHIVKIERRFEQTELGLGDQGLFKMSMRDTFSEVNYCSPKYKCTMVRIPMARPGMVYGLRKIQTKPTIPTEEEIYEFGHQLFKSVQLSSECSIVCLIYVERLMEVARVPLLADTWRPIFMCGLLLASKVWQDLSSWNIEFASVYPQYSLEAINKLELNFLRNVKWDLYISSSLYAKYYFALRSLVEKIDFRQRYNRMVGGVDSVAQSEAMKIAKRTEQFKEVALLQLSRSM